MALQSLNGRAVSWAEIKITINIAGGPTFDTIDIKSIQHEGKVDTGDVRGASGGRKRKDTTGALTDTASATFYRDGMKELKRALIPFAPKDAKGRPRLSLVRWDMVINHSFDDDAEIHCTKLNGCRLLQDSGKHEEGTDAETVDTTLNPLEIVEVIDGVDTVLL